MEIICRICGYPAIFIEEISANEIDSEYPEIIVSVFKCIHCSYYNALLTDQELLENLPNFEERLQDYYANLTTSE